MTEQRFTAREALQYGFTKYGENATYCLSMTALVEVTCLAAAASLAFNMTVAAQLLTQLDSPPPDTYFYCFVLMYFVVRTLAQVFAHKWILMLYDGRKMSASEMLGFDTSRHFSQIVRMLAASLAYGFYAAIGTCLFVLPALFVTSTLRFFRFFIIDKNVEAFAGLRESYALSSGHNVELIALNLFSLLLKLLGLLCFGIFFLPASAVSGLAQAYAYRRLTTLFAEPVVAAEADNDLQRQSWHY